MVTEGIDTERVDEEEDLIAGTPEFYKAMALELYERSRLPVGDIARICDVSRQTVYNWIDEAGMPRRGPRGRQEFEDDDDLAPPLDQTNTAPQLAALTAEMRHLSSQVTEVLGAIRLVVQIVLDRAKPDT